MNSGLRLQGISSSTDENRPASQGVLVDEPILRTIVDHNDLSSFTLAAVDWRDRSKRRSPPPARQAGPAIRLAPA